MPKHSQYQRGVVVIGKNTPPTQSRRKLPHNAQVRFLSFTAANSGRNRNWPSICRHGWASAFENSQKKSHKQKKTRRRMARERRGAESSVVSMETRFLHTGSFTHRRFYTQTLLHTDAFYTQALLHTEAFTHRRFYTQTLLHTDAFTHRRFYTQTLFTHRLFYTQRLLHTEAFTRRDFYTQTLLHTDAFTHRRFYTNTFTRRDCYRQTL